MGNRAYGLIEPVDSAFDWIKWFEPSLLAAALGGDGGAASAAVRGRRGGDSVACCHADDTLGPERATRGAWRQLIRECPVGRAAPPAHPPRTGPSLRPRPPELPSPAKAVRRPRSRSAPDAALGVEPTVPTVRRGSDALEWRIAPVGASYAEPSGGPGRRRWGGIGGGEGAARR